MTGPIPSRWIDVDSRSGVAMAVTSSHEHPTVLVVDDEPKAADVYALWLSGSYRVLTAESADEALDELDDDVDVVLLDRRMPGRSGDDVLRTIRKRGFDCRVAMVTAVDPDFDIVDMGFDTYLTKPVDKDELVETVERLLTLAERDRKSQELFTLARKRAVLEVEKSDRELAVSEEYAALTERLGSVKDDLDRSVNRMDREMFAASFHAV